MATRTIRHGGIWTNLGLIGGLFFTISSTAVAAMPYVEFDVSYTVACREVTPPEFVTSHPEQKIVEATFQISTLLRQGSEQDIAELMIVIDSPERRLRVSDFLPKTRMVSDLTGPVEIVENDEEALSLDGSIGVHFGPLETIKATPSAGISKTHLENQTKKYSRLPPKQLLVAAGITNRQHGVFFKLNPSNRASLEGQREFVCLFVVPVDWRGDFARVHCAARGYNRSLWTRIEPSGHRDVLVGLYLVGDVEARDAAGQFADAGESYLQAHGSLLPAEPSHAGQLDTLLRWVPFGSVVEDALEDLDLDVDEESEARQEAYQALRVALEDLARLHG